MAAPSTTRAPTLAHNNVLGIVAVLGAGFFMISSDACVRQTLGEIPLGEAIMGRGGTACILLSLAGLATGTLKWHPGMLSRPMYLRIVGEIGAALLFISALARMPIANATAILQFIPLVTTVAAAWLFREHVGWQRWLAGLVGLVGVLLILKPGTAGFTWWSLLAVAAMLCMSMRDLATSRVDRGVPTLLIGSVSAGAVSLSGLALLPFAPWVVPSWTSFGLVGLSGLLLAAGFICLVVGMRSAEISAVAPFRYGVIIWAILIGIFAWGEIPDPIAFVGIVIVIGAGLVMLARERRLARRRAAA